MSDRIFERIPETNIEECMQDLKKNCKISGTLVEILKESLEKI